MGDVEEDVDEMEEGRGGHGLYWECLEDEELLPVHLHPSDRFVMFLSLELWQVCWSRTFAMGKHFSAQKLGGRPLFPTNLCRASQAGANWSSSMTLVELDDPGHGWEEEEFGQTN